MASRTGRNGRFARERASACFSDDEWRDIATALGLGERQLGIVKGVFDGLGDVEIGLELGISRHTVHEYVKRVYRKLGVHNRAELVMSVFLAWREVERREGLGLKERRVVAV